jgi:transposase-like protein
VEFRAEAIRLARTGGKARREIADGLGMSSETLGLWLKQADLDEGKHGLNVRMLFHTWFLAAHST